MTLQTYYPEMNQPKPVAQIEARMSHDGRHYYLTSPLHTLAGRGVTMIEVLTAATLVPQAHHKIGWAKYRVTESAFRRICAEHAVSMECLL